MLPVVPAAGDFNFPYTAFLARAGLWNNPDFQENGVPASSQRGEQRKSPSKDALSRGCKNFLAVRGIVSLTVNVSFSSLPFSLGELSSVNDCPLQGRNPGP
jgi:hypothetical protein